MDTASTVLFGQHPIYQLIFVLVFEFENIGAPIVYTEINRFIVFSV